MTEPTQQDNSHDVPVEIANGGGDSILPPEGDRRQDATSKAFRAVYHKMQSTEIRLDAQDKAIKENTELTQKIKNDTGEIVEAFASFKGAFKVLNWIGSLAKPVAYLVMLGSALYGLIATVKGGTPPHHPIK